MRTLKNNTNFNKRDKEVLCDFITKFCQYVAELEAEENECNQEKVA